MIVPAVAVNVVEVAAEGTVTDVAVTGNKVLLLANETTVPLVGAALLNLTVHVVAASEFKVVGLQASEDSVTEVADATRLTVTV